VLLASVCLPVYLAFVTVADPFVSIDGTRAAGLLMPAAWLIPVVVAGLWFARRRRWPQAFAAAVFL
jgi:hypothetical protein